MLSTTEQNSMNEVRISPSHSRIRTLQLRNDYPESRKVDFTPQPNINNEALRTQCIRINDSVAA